MIKRRRRRGRRRTYDGPENESLGCSNIRNVFKLSRKLILSFMLALTFLCLCLGVNDRPECSCKLQCSQVVHPRTLSQWNTQLPEWYTKPKNELLWPERFIPEFLVKGNIQRCWKYHFIILIQQTLLQKDIRREESWNTMYPVTYGWFLEYGNSWKCRKSTSAEEGATHTIEACNVGNYQNWLR